MKPTSKLFDSIRVKPDPEQVLRKSHPTCEWVGCENAATHKAPKGRGAEGLFFHYCIDHVREYNKSYNYFSGMKDDAVAAYQKDALTGHRPTWTMGLNARSWARTHHGDEASGYGSTMDPSVVLRRARYRRAQAATASPEPQRRRLKALEIKSLEVLSLDETATGPEIKSRYKELVKRHHPDANGGDRSSEDLLQEIIRAYNHLKSVGLC
jgi:curved DNA-binding protein CbpA